MDSFEQHGFSKQAATDLRTSIRAKYQPLFDFADRCSDVALDFAALLPLSRTRRVTRQLILSQFFARALAHFRSSLILTETGLTVESLVLTRGLLETCFVMLSIAEDAVTFAELMEHDNAMRLNHANALRTSTRYPDVDQFKPQLDAFAERIGGAKEIGFYEFARRGKAIATYDGLYRHLSNHAAHSSLSAVDDYLVKDTDGSWFVSFRPLTDRSPAAILTACAGILLAGFACEKGKIATPIISSRLASTWTEYESLYVATDPWK
jgi:hypothetical protein